MIELSIYEFLLKREVFLKINKLINKLKINVITYFEEKKK